MVTVLWFTSGTGECAVPIMFDNSYYAFTVAGTQTAPSRPTLPDRYRSPPTPKITYLHGVHVVRGKVGRSRCPYHFHLGIVCRIAHARPHHNFHCMIPVPYGHVAACLRPHHHSRKNRKVGPGSQHSVKIDAARGTILAYSLGITLACVAALFTQPGRIFC